ncbi:hypothetical protein [Nonomuraea sp. NPDC002799]
MRITKRVAAGALAAAAVLAPAAASADTPYAQASVLVDWDGSQGASKNVLRTYRVTNGEYCVVVSDSVNLYGAEGVHATPVGDYRFPRWLSVEIGSPACGSVHSNAIAVHSKNADGDSRDAAFYLTVS